MKHVEFYFKNKFEKLVHLVGFIIRIYHDAQSPERQIRKNNLVPRIIKSPDQIISIAFDQDAGK
jgi:hypothetical protein